MFGATDHRYASAEPLLCFPLLLLWEHIPALLSESGRANALDELLKVDKRISKSTFYKVLRRWLEGGCILENLVPRWPGQRKPLDLGGLEEITYETSVNATRQQSQRLMKCEEPRIDTSDHTKTGRARKRRNIHARTLFTVDRDAIRVFRKYRDRKLNTPGETLKAAYNAMRREVFVTSSPTGESVQWPLWVIPSFVQFEDWYYRLTNHKQRRVAAIGEHSFELSERPIEGQNVTSTYRAGQRASLDATVWNVTLVSSRPGAAPIGPPIVFRMRCKDSGVLMGLCVGLENASWLGAASAIANCLEDKFLICRGLGIEKINPEDFAAPGLPAEIEADCGETDNHKPNRFIERTGVALTNLQYGRGDIKAGVESDFNTLQVGLNGMTPSAVIKKFEESTKRSWKMKGSMTLEAFTRMLWLEELKRSVRPRPELKLPPAMIEDGVDSSPISMWNWMIRKRPIALRRFKLDEVKKALLDTSTGLISGAGLEFKGLIYRSGLLDASALSKARAGGISVNVAFDARLADTVYIMEGDKSHPSSYVECRLNLDRPDQRDLAGMTFREAEQIRLQGDRTNASAAESVSQRTSDWTHQQEETVKSSNERTRAERAGHPAVSVSQHLKSMPSARTEEKNLTSPKLALVPSASQVTEPGQRDCNPEAEVRKVQAGDTTMPTERPLSRFAQRAFDRAKEANANSTETGGNT